MVAEGLSNALRASTTTNEFAPLGNRTQTTIGSDTTTYSYDDADRLTQGQPPSPASAIGYTWNDNGNLTDRGSDSFSWGRELTRTEWSRRRSTR